MSEQGSRFTSVTRQVGIFSWSVLGFLVLVFVGGYLIIQGRIILAPLLLAVVVIFILNPLVTVLHGRGLHRMLGTAIGFLLIIAALFLVGFLVIPSIADQATSFAETFPDIYANSAGQIEDIAERLGLSDVRVWTYEEVVDYVQDPDNRDVITSFVLDRLGGVTAGIFEFILIFVLGPVLAFYLLIDLPSVQQRGLDLVPERGRAEVAWVGRKLNTAVGGFLRGQLLVALIVGVMLSVGYRLIDLQFWLLIGMIGGILNIVPLLGPWVGGAMGVIVALATADLSTALWAVLVAVVVQQIDNNFVSPSVLRATVRLHPAVTLIVLVLGGAIAGIWGVIIAVPLAAVIKILLGHWWRTRMLGQTWEEAGDALIEEHEPRRRLFSTAEMAAVTSDSDDDEEGPVDHDGD